MAPQAFNLIPLSPVDERQALAIQILHLFSIALMSLFLVCVALGRLRRHALITTFFCQIAVLDVVHLMLWSSKEVPSFGLCYTQASLWPAIWGAEAVSAVSLKAYTLNLVLQRHWDRSMSERWLTRLAIGLQALVFVVFASVGFATTATRPQDLVLGPANCTASNNITRTFFYFILIPLVCSLVFLVWVLYFSSQNLRSIGDVAVIEDEKLHPGSPSTMQKVVLKPSAEFMFKNILFLNIVFVTIAVAIDYIVRQDKRVPTTRYLQASCGIFLFPIFGPRFSDLPQSLHRFLPSRLKFRTPPPSTTFFLDSSSSPKRREGGTEGGEEEEDVLGFSEMLECPVTPVVGACGQRQGMSVGLPPSLATLKKEEEGEGGGGVGRGEGEVETVPWLDQELTVLEVVLGTPTSCRNSASS